MKERVRGFRGNRDAGRQKELETDFGEVLAVWGIEDEADIPDILRDLRLRRLLLALPLPLALAAAFLTPGLPTFLTLALIAPPCLLGLLTARWRMSVLQHRAFIPFHRWLTARFIKKGAKQ